MAAARDAREAVERVPRFAGVLRAQGHRTVAHHDHSVGVLDDQLLEAARQARRVPAVLPGLRVVVAAGDAVAGEAVAF